MTIHGMSSGTKKQLVIAGMVAAVVIAAAVYVNRGNQRVVGEAYRLRDEAKAAFNAQSNVDHVRVWLQERGWIIGTDAQGNWVSAYYKKDAGPFDPPEHLIVRAYKELGTEDNVPGGRWVSLQFRFNPDRTYQSVYLNPSAPPPPSHQPATR
jgi:hypothetical protein